ncbi:MAG TPA: hypothetical protein VKH15_02325 [Candidatus Acidoferrum sp.]|nr:hypothetical protein [Candidatus Acidoferrum sp.]
MASLEAAVTEKMRIDNTFSNRQAEARHKKVHDLFPHKLGVGFFHGVSPVRELSRPFDYAFFVPEGKQLPVNKARDKQRRNTKVTEKKRRERR